MCITHSEEYNYEIKIQMKTDRRRKLGRPKKRLTEQLRMQQVSSYSVSSGRKGITIGLRFHSGSICQKKKGGHKM